MRVLGGVDAALSALTSTDGDSPVMGAAKKAAKVVDGWSHAKRDYADRVTAAPCEHDWKIWPETDGQIQRCMKCKAYRDTPAVTRPVGNSTENTEGGAA